MPLPAPESLPSVERLLASETTASVVPREVAATPSPARAAPHDEMTWLPLPEIDDLPPIDELLVPDSDVELPAPREVPVSVPSPARAEPHDAAAWLPLPDLHGLSSEGDDGAAAPRPRRQMHLPRVPARALLVAMLVVAVMGAAAYGVARVTDPGDDVELRVDGRVVSTETGVSTVGALLNEENILLGEHDRVVPNLAAPIENDMVVKVARSFPVNVNFDGGAITVFTTHTEPEAFLAEAYPSGGVSIRNPPKRVTQDAPILVRTSKSGALIVDGQTVQYREEPAHTVRELLEDLDVKLGPEDVTSPIGVDEALPDKQAIAVKRVNLQTITRVEDYTLPDERRADPDLEVGKERVQEPVVGSQTVTYSLVFNNRVVIEQVPISKVPIVEAKARVTYYGTKADPRWDKIAECETGGKWSAQGPTYQGGLGIYYRNWLHYRDKDMPMNAGDATREQQIVVGIRIKNEHGWRAWGCARTLGYTGKN